MTTTWAAKVLEGVGRIWAYSYEVNEADNGAEPEDWKTFQTWDVADPYPILGKEYVAVDDALAAIAKLGAGDGLVERLLAYSSMDDHLSHRSDTERRAAAHIAALTAQVAEAQADLSGMVSEGRRMRAEYNIAADQLAKAQADNAALRERVARLEGALNAIDAMDPEQQINGFSESALRGTVLHMGGIARAALTDGGSDE